MIEVIDLSEKSALEIAQTFHATFYPEFQGTDHETLRRLAAIGLEPPFANGNNTEKIQARGALEGLPIYQTLSRSPRTENFYFNTTYFGAHNYQPSDRPLNSVEIFHDRPLDNEAEARHALRRSLFAKAYVEFLTERPALF